MLTELDDLQTRLNALTETVDKLLTRQRRFEAVCQAVLDDLNARYDGAPDSSTLWMGSLIRDLEAVLPAVPPDIGNEFSPDEELSLDSNGPC